ncbi:YCF48-related protein [Pseudomonas extremaustralis]|uniref:WD40/YVTN/BNR-like repeat-containing protein n=1 Tax=Pseudomonas extremaustralis TaxID=359110 RepID=UPI002861DF23|nr:YCF48-related protein [Pseudomonas extremaustralis]MDR6575882.1 photosystem II stability/assembly factor-like uncharacterized protein [Pseudomonas extremaustralis]
MKQKARFFPNALKRTYCALCVALLSASPACVVLAQAFEAPLNVAAEHSPRMLTSPMLAVASAGSRLVAVGLRGSIIVSNDQGKTWVQAQVPVSIDLVAVTFASAQSGWAVGHGGIVLHSSDGGMTWEKQLDGLQASKLAIDFYSRNPEHIADAAGFLTKENNLAVEEETQPFLDVYFADDQHGYVVGTFNRIFATQDGGKTWAPLMHRSGNPQEWHFYSVSGNNGQVYLSGEQGRVWRLDQTSQEFVAINTPYNGTLFGITAQANGQVYAYGMRGSFFHSSDQGQTWQRSKLPFASNVMRVISSGNKRLLVVAQSGEIVQSQDDGQTFSPVPLTNPMQYFGAALLDSSHLALAGALGVRIEAL